MTPSNPSYADALSLAVQGLAFNHEDEVMSEYDTARVRAETIGVVTAEFDPRYDTRVLVEMLTDRNRSRAERENILDALRNLRNEDMRDREEMEILTGQGVAAQVQP